MNAEMGLGWQWANDIFLGGTDGANDNWQARPGACIQSRNSRNLHANMCAIPVNVIYAHKNYSVPTSTASI